MSTPCKGNCVHTHLLVKDLCVEHFFQDLARFPKISGCSSAMDRRATFSAFLRGDLLSLQNTAQLFGFLFAKNIQRNYLQSYVLLLVVTQGDIAATFTVLQRDVTVHVTGVSQERLMAHTLQDSILLPELNCASPFYACTVFSSESRPHF